MCAVQPTLLHKHNYDGPWGEPQHMHEVYVIDRKREIEDDR